MRGQQSIDLPVPTQGLVANVPAHRLPPNAVETGSNVYVDLDGLLKPRNGYTVLGTPAVVEQFMGMLSYKDYDGGFHTIVATFTTWQDATAATFVNITGTPNTGGADNFVRFAVLPGADVNIYGVNGVDPIRTWDVGDSAYSTVNGTNAPTTCQDLITLGGRLVALNTIESGTNFFYRIRWSEINDGTTWNALGFLDLLDVAEEIVGGALTSNLSAVIYTTNNAYFLYAVPGDDSSCFAVEKIPGSDYISGPASPAALVSAEGAHYWQGSDGKIWTFDGTSIHTISDPVDSVLRNMVDFSSVRRAHACYNEPNRQITFFFPALGDNSEPMHAVVYDLRLQCFLPIWTFSEPITSSATIVTTIGPEWLNWVSPTDTWLTIPYAAWDDIPIGNEITALIGTSNNVYNFFTGSTDNSATISFTWTSPLICQDVKTAINLTDFELYFNPASASEPLLIQWYGLIEPYSTPVLIWQGVLDAGTAPGTQTLLSGSQAEGAAVEPFTSQVVTSQQTGAASQRYTYLQLVVTGSVTATSGRMAFAGGTMWVNSLRRGNYGSQ